MNRIWLYLPLILFFSCTSLQKDLVIESSDIDQFQEIGEWELTLVRLMNSAYPGDVRRDLDELREEMEQADPSLNRQYAASLLALRAWEAWLSRDRRRAESLLEEAMSEDSRVELVILVQSYLTSDPAEALLILQEGNPGQFYRLSAREGELLFEMGDFGAALTRLDEAMNQLPKEYQELYRPVRDKAWELKDSNIRGDIAGYLSDEPLEMGQMVEIIQEETLLLDSISRQNKLNDGALFKELQERGYIREEKQRNRTADRSDAAILLWNLLIDKEKEPDWRGSYRGKFTVTPIEDVKLDDPWFEAVLGCVEREIMSLPDGRLFYPGLLVSGLDFLEMLRALESY